MEIFVGFIVYMLILFLTNNVYEKAPSELEREQKPALIELFRKERKRKDLIPIILLVVWFIVLYYQLLAANTALVCIGFAEMLLFVAQTFLAYKKLANHLFPAFFLKSFLIVSSIRIFSILILFTGIIIFILNTYSLGF
jgi:hypothetical protein